MSDRSDLPIRRLAAEFALIVMGVLVALLAESAWQERGERAEGAEVLDRVRRELVLDSTLIARDRLWLNQALPVIEEAREILGGTTTGSPGGDLTILMTASFRRIDRLRAARTYDDLLASGRMSLIQEPAIRRALITFYGELDEAIEVREDLSTRYRDRVAARVPVSYVSRLLSECMRDPEDPEGVPGDVAERIHSCGIEPEGGAGPVVAELRATPGLREDLGVLGFETFTALEHVSRAEDDFEVLRNLLEDAR